MTKINKSIAIFLMGFFLALAAVNCGTSSEIVTTSPPTSVYELEVPAYVGGGSTVPETTTTTTTVVVTTIPPITTVPYKVSTTTTRKPTTTTTIKPKPVPPTTVQTDVEEMVAPVVQSGVGSFLECVKQHESRGNYSAVNPSSGAGGAYQFLPNTWNNTARHIGRGDLVGLPPQNADPATQDMMALALLNWYGRSPWNGSGC